MVRLSWTAAAIGLWVLFNPFGSPLAAQGDFEWQGRLASGDVIEIRGIVGDIRATGSNGGAVEVVATKHGRRSDFQYVTVEVVEHDGGVIVCAVYPSKNRSRDDDCGDRRPSDVDIDDIDVEVQFEVLVPSGIRFEGTTVAGDVDVEGLDADVRVRTVSGDVSVVTSGLARASSVSGSVRASLGRADWTGMLEFETVSGDVEIVVPSDFNADVTLATLSGDVETDFPLTLQNAQLIGQRIRGTVGEGGRRLKMNTVSGDVVLRRAR